MLAPSARPMMRVAPVAMPAAQRAMISGLVAMTAALLGPTTAVAHNPQLATFTLHDAPPAPLWIEAATAQVAIEAALKARNPGLDLRALGLPGVKTATLRYLRGRVHVTALPSGRSLGHAGGGVRLGGHETRARLVFAPAPPGTYAWEVHIDAFTEDGSQSNLLRSVRGQARHKQIILGRAVLGQANSYRAVIAVAGGSAERLSLACTMLTSLRETLSGFAPGPVRACAVALMRPTSLHPTTHPGGHDDHHHRPQP